MSSAPRSTFAASSLRLLLAAVVATIVLGSPAVSLTSRATAAQGVTDAAAGTSPEPSSPTLPSAPDTQPIGSGPVLTWTEVAVDERLMEALPRDRPAIAPSR